MGVQFSDAHTDQYRRDGYCKAEGLFSPDEVKELGAEMAWIIEEWWGEESIGWRGPWRAASPPGSGGKLCLRKVVRCARVTS